MRRRPLLRTAMIGGGAYAIGKHSAQKQEAQQQQQAQQPAAPAAPAPAPAPVAAAPQVDVVAKLQELSQLKDSGALSDAEFNAAKAKLLA